MIIDKEYEQIKLYREKLNTIEECLNINKLNDEISKIEAMQSEDSFWQDLKKATELNKELKRKQNIVSNFSILSKNYQYLNELAEIIIDSEQDDDLMEELIKTLKEFENQLEINYITTLLNGRYDNSDAILSLHAGAGGVESQDWASMLYRMYNRYSERKGFSVSILDYQDGDEAGIKSITLKISGENAYGFLKAESGVHRLVRISPFDANARRHTSFCSCEVIPMIENDTEIVINPDDLRIDTFRASGAGGQHVNKTDSAVRITHLPTGIVTTCQNQRSQIQNKEVAMGMLLGKLAEIKEHEEQEKLAKLKGEIKKIEWGSQIRSYIFCPYTLVKDHRTNFETSNLPAVMDGEIEDFIIAYLKKK